VISTEADPALIAAFAAARELCHQSFKDLYFASFFLPRRKRQAAYAVGAFCRMIDQAIDVPASAIGTGRTMREHPVIPRVSLEQLPPENVGEACEGDTLSMRLDLLRDRLDEIYEDRLELPALEGRSPQQHALYALSRVARESEIDRQLFIDFAESCRMKRMERRDLLKYCQLAGGSVAAMLACVLGVTHSEGRRHAITLGSAMSLAANIRDDADVDRARAMFRDAAEGICWLADDGSRLAVATATVFSAAALERRGRLSATQKLLRMPRAVRLARRLHVQPLPEFF
jgi:phytoene/squalene synthetase